MKSEACNEDIKKVSLLPALFFSLIQFSTVTDNSSLMNASSAIANNLNIGRLKYNRQMSVNWSRNCRYFYLYYLIEMNNYYHYLIV